MQQWFDLTGNTTIVQKTGITIGFVFLAGEII